MPHTPYLVFGGADNSARHNAPVSRASHGGQRGMDATNLADIYGTPLLEWADVDERLGQGLTQAAPVPAARTAIRAGWPRSTPTGALTSPGSGALWVDGSFWFETGGNTRKGRNLARDPRWRAAAPPPRSSTWWWRVGAQRIAGSRDGRGEWPRVWAAAGLAGRGRRFGNGAHRRVRRPPSAGRPPWFVYQPDASRPRPRCSPSTPAARPVGASRREQCSGRGEAATSSKTHADVVQCDIPRAPRTH